jgi:hypothetical protein
MSCVKSLTAASGRAVGGGAARDGGVCEADVPAPAATVAKSRSSAKKGATRTMSSGPDSAPGEPTGTGARTAGLPAEGSALLEKYRQERDKRIRADGFDQYRKTEGELSHFFLSDPSAAPSPERMPVDEEVDVVIIGGGWSGILIAVRLRQAGVDSIGIIEARDGLGGLWT